MNRTDPVGAGFSAPCSRATLFACACGARIKQIHLKRQTLSNSRVGLELTRGQVALVGDIAGSASVLIKLCTRLYRCDGGSISVNQVRRRSSHIVSRMGVYPDAPKPVADPISLQNFPRASLQRRAWQTRVFIVDFPSAVSAV